MNKSNPRTVLKKIVLLSYTLSMIVFSCIVIGFSKDFAIIISVPFHISCHTAYTFSAPRFQADSNA